MNYWIIYVLKLEDECWYVGRTTQQAFKERMKDHWNGKAAWFTKEHKPIRIHNIEIYPRDLTDSEAEVHENERTLILAKELGYDYVRGGGYTQRKPNWTNDPEPGIDNIPRFVNL